MNDQYRIYHINLHSRHAKYTWFNGSNMIAERENAIVYTSFRDALNALLEFAADTHMPRLPNNYGLEITETRHLNLST